jgi:hypothetical protein
MKLWDTVSGGTVPAAVAGMDGSYNLLLDITDFVQKVLPEDDEYYVAFRWRSPNNYNLALITFYNGATALGWLGRAATTGILTVYIGTGSGSPLLSSASGLSINTTYLVEVRFKPLNSGGVFQVKINGILVIDFSGDTTPGATTITSIKLGSQTYYGWAYFDNIVVDNAAWPGNTKIQAIVPTGAGTAAQWTPSAGANYECVDEVPASEADYIQTNTVDHLDTYAVGDLVGTIATVKCVQAQALAIAEGAPTPPDIQLAVRSGGTDYFSADKQVPTGSAQLSHLWETDPATAAAWLEAGVNAMEIGVKAVA